MFPKILEKWFNLIHYVILTLTSQLSPNPNSIPQIKCAQINIAHCFFLFELFFQWRTHFVKNIVSYILLALIKLHFVSVYGSWCCISRWHICSELVELTYKITLSIAINYSFLGALMKRGKKYLSRSVHSVTLILKEGEIKQVSWLWLLSKYL